MKQQCAALGAAERLIYFQQVQQQFVDLKILFFYGPFLLLRRDQKEKVLDQRAPPAAFVLNNG